MDLVLNPKLKRYLAGEFSSWWISETHEFGELIFRLLAGLPGGDEAEDLGYTPIGPLGWKELQLLTELLDKIQDAEDVEATVRVLISHKYNTGGIESSKDLDAILAGEDEE